MRGAALLRRAGLGAIVDATGALVGRIAVARPVTIDGVRLAGNHAGQLWYVNELHEGRERYMTELLCRGASTGGIVVDAGAYIGFVAIRLAQSVGPHGRVLAFEPEPGVREALVRNVARNGVADRVDVLPFALGAAAGRGVLHIGGGGETSSLAPLAGARGEVEIEVRALDDVLPEGRVDAVKLDLEGGETAALRGMRRVLERSGERVVLVVECYPGRLAAMGSSRDELLGVLAELGFTARVIDESRRSLDDSTAVSWDYANLLCSRLRFEPPTP